MKNIYTEKPICLCSDSLQNDMPEVLFLSVFPCSSRKSKYVFEGKKQICLTGS